ncbi:MAG: DUF1810 family protein, partial [Cetobacterium sp.]
QEENSFFWQLFVPKTKCYLNNKVNNNVALVNGAPLISHSLTFETPDAFDKIMQHIEENNIPFGSEIVIDMPLAVNFIVEPTLDNKPISAKRRRQLNKLRAISQQYNIDPNSDDIIIPLTTDICTTKKKWERFAFCTGNFLSPVATVQMRDPFPYDLGFAMTVHKAQGRTIHRVVLALSYHPSYFCRMTYAGIFVAMSRVTHGDHLRLLEPLFTRDRLSLYTYLENIRPNRNIKPFLHGYNTDGTSVWSPEAALSFSTQNPKPSLKHPFSHSTILSPSNQNPPSTSFTSAPTRPSTTATILQPSTAFPPDPHNIKRFLQPHFAHFQNALAEIKAGTKTTHWSWFLLPSPPHLD